MEELILKEREFKGKIVEVINNSGLPAFIIKPILKEVLEKIFILEENQYKQACEKINNKEKNGGTNHEKNS